MSDAPLHHGHYAVLRYLGGGWQRGMPVAPPHVVLGVNKKWMPDLKRRGLASWDGVRGHLTTEGMSVLVEHLKGRRWK